MRILLQHATRYGIRSFGTLSSSPTVASAQTLQHRISDALYRNAQILPVLEHWRQQGNQVNPSHVRVIIKKLRDSNQSHQALQVSEWMSRERICNLIPEDFAARLHLIENVVGLEEAEKFFESIPKNARDDSVYTTLLNSYARSDKTLCKAEATFLKMRELGFLLRPYPFNAMMSLYCALKDRDKVEELLREMKGNDVEPDSVTVNNVLKLYSAVCDVTAMEKFLNKWEAIHGIKLEWLTTLDMAKAYVRARSSGKAVKMLRLTEKLVDDKSLKSAYDHLMKLYGEAGEKEEVLRIWNLYKKNIGKRDNDGYRTVIRSLLKVDDIVEAEKIYKVWESLPLEFDIRIPTMLASGYRDRGMTEMAEKLMSSKAVKDRRMNKPITPLLEQWGHQMKQSDLKCLIKNLHDSNQFSKALQVSEWMGEKRVSSLYSEDYAARLYLTENVLGLEEAEKYFENIPENMKDYSVYTALLSFYAKSDKNMGKAMTTFKKMRELGFLLKPSPFSLILSLHKQSNMVEEILREMEENNVDPDSLTVNKVLKIYAAESKVEEMEMFMRQWGRGDGIKLDSGTVAAMAKAYAKAGSIKKAIEMYGDVAGCKREVHLLWDKYMKTKEEEQKEADKVKFGRTPLKIDDGYRIVISSLLKLDDVQGAEKVYGEWIPSGPKLDVRIPGLLISRFCTEGNAFKWSYGWKVIVDFTTTR
ncbi:PREDICTED: putative pentatricopeptide repeat-containing protein At1g28020 [Camelina sativa]|uniref:Pentatricopeptide repeat-containing protein At1g28020 n=1 Tax=Camelina sativa TaxID=90675 RepID=A0ABM1QWC2_CAMSA|nr:PREDICTED: putative pentatricopeptide repeat-containing protein At1g28020 [Camelina sativa]